MNERADYGHWSTAELALKAMTKERDLLLLQVDELKSQLRDSEGDHRQIHGLQAKIDELMEFVRKVVVAGPCQNCEVHTLDQHEAHRLWALYGNPREVKALVDKRKCELPHVITQIDGGLRCSTSGCDDPAACNSCFGCKEHCAELKIEEAKKCQHNSVRADGAPDRTICGLCGIWLS